jgi:hypothetical protein
MNINEILTKIEYTKERSAKELFGWFTLKNEELRAWSGEHPKIKHRELSKGLPDKFLHELTPFAYYAKTYYCNKTKVRFKPCCGSEQYDGIIIDNGNEVFVEITEAKFGNEWAIQKEVHAETGIAPWEYSILGVNKKNRAKKKQLAIDMIIGNEIEDSPAEGCICKLVEELVKKRVEDKRTKKYGQNKTILIVTFDETGFSKKDWDDFVDFKQAEIDSMEHNFRKIILFGWLDKKFIS